MRQETLSAMESRAERSRGALAASRRGRFLLTAVLLSVAFHLGAALLIAFLPRVLPQEARPQEQGTIELLMVEQKGAGPNQAGQPTETTPTSAPPESKPKSKEASPVERRAPASNAKPAPPVAENGDEPAPRRSEQAQSEAAQPEPDQPEPAHPGTKPTPRQAEAQPAPPASKEAPVFNLEGTESESNALALGPQILPAMPDNRFRNRPPVYPAEAEIRGQHGAVVVMIHVSENGSATGVDVTESSGVEVLDQAAVAAVRKWHFHPAIKQGRAIPFDMPFRFIFEAY